VFAETISNQMAPPPCVEWWGETYNWTTTPFGHCPKILTAVPVENWRRPPGRPHTMWMKTIRQDLKCKQTSPWAKRLSWIRIVHSGDWCLHLALRTNGGACHKRRRRRRCI